MSRLKKPDQKLLELKNTGTLNPHPAAVSDTLFRENLFFDSKDLLQVRYEMLRRHRVDGSSVVEVASVFGVSRPTFYQAEAAFEKERPDGSGSQAARSQGGTQTVRPSDRTRADVEVFLSQPDRPSNASEPCRRSSASPFIAAAWNGPWRAKKNRARPVEITAAGHRHRSIRGAATAKWCDPTDTLRMPKVEAFSFAAAWRDGRSIRRSPR